MRKTSISEDIITKNITENSNKITALLINLDNILYETRLFHHLAWKTMCSEAGLKYDRSWCERLMGMRNEEGLEFVLSNNPGYCAPKVLKELLSTKVGLLYRQYFSSLTPSEVSGEVRRALSTLRKQGYRILVYSTGENARNILEKLGLDDAVDIIYDERVVSAFWPDEEAFDRMCSLLKIQGKNGLVVDSTTPGLIAAKHLGLKTASPVSNEEGDLHFGAFPDLLNQLHSGEETQ